MKEKLLYETEYKYVYSTNNDNQVWIEFKNENFYRHSRDYTQKAAYNNKISQFIFELLNFRGIPTSFEKTISETEQLCKNLKEIPIKIVIRNYLTDEEARKYNLKNGFKLSKTIMELYITEPYEEECLVNESIIESLNLLPNHELDFIKEQSLRINQILSTFWLEYQIVLSDFELYFGRDRKQFYLFK